MALTLTSIFAYFLRTFNALSRHVIFMFKNICNIRTRKNSFLDSRVKNQAIAKLMKYLLAKH